MKKIILILLSVFIFNALNAQDIDDLLNGELDEETNYVSATFKATRIINGHSVEQMKKKHLDFRISHRFGVLSNGISDFFGMDQSSIRLDFEYGLTDWLQIAVGRSSFDKTYLGSLKFKLLKQSTGKKNMPVSISYFISTDIFTRDFIDLERNNYSASRFSYIHQILVARKFNDKLSLQLTPTLIHRNLVPTVLDNNDVYAIGAGGRYKISKRIALTAEYYYTFRYKRNPLNYNDPLSFGIDIETGGHVFQIMFTNTSIMNEKGFILGQNNDDFFKGDIHLGFNISRVFSFK